MTHNGRIIIIFILIDSGWQIESIYRLLNSSFYCGCCVIWTFIFLTVLCAVSYDSFIENDGPWPILHSLLSKQGPVGDRIMRCSE